MGDWRREGATVFDRLWFRMLISISRVDALWTLAYLERR